MEAIKRIVMRLWPELNYGYHLPMLARVIQITDAPKDGGDCTMDRPRFAVDIQPLNQHGEEQGELLPDVPVAIPYAGNHRGFYNLPDPGSIVEYAFAFGRPDQPYVRSTLPIGLKLPTVDKNESRWQKSVKIYQGYDSKDNWHRHTSADIQESCDKVRQCTAKAKQLLKSPKTWLGSDQENLLQIIIDSLSELEISIGIIASHTHNGGNVGAPDQSGDISSSVSKLSAIRSKRLEPITE